MMPVRQTLPRLWLLSDVRNDAVLPAALARLPRGSGFVFRHYHLPPPRRRARFAELACQAWAFGHCVVLAGTAIQARAWRADGAYAAPDRLGRPTGGLRLASVHDAVEIAVAARAHADAVLLSPAFPTNTHPGASTLGPLRFRTLAALSPVPVIALGGMDWRTARRLAWRHWAAIDGLSDPGRARRLDAGVPRGR